MRIVARELESVGLSFAFVGGCAVWLLVDRPDLTDFRPTEDVDVIIEVVTRDEHEAKHRADEYFQYFDELGKGTKPGSVAVTLKH